MRHFAAQRLAVALLLVGACIVAASAVADLRERRSSPESVVRSYFAALEAGDDEAALATLAPDARDGWTPFVENGLNNTYRITGIAVRQPSLLERFTGELSAPTDLTVFLVITQFTDGFEWQAGPQVRLVREESRWYLARPPLA